MAIKELKKIDKKLTQIYEEQVTTNVSTNANYIDRSEVILEYMNFIAMNNKNFLNIK